MKKFSTWVLMGVAALATVNVATADAAGARADRTMDASAKATAAGVTYSGSLPVLFIETEGGVPILSKDSYVRASYWLDNMNVADVASLGSAEAPLGMQIRGRGNWSWTGFDKKPYRLKLDTKEALAGLDKSKHFALLAHADDTFGFMRNVVGLELSRMIGMPWTPAETPVEVVLNGDYIGLYFLTETIRVDKDRVNIVEQPDLATSPEEITGGWLVEIDNYDTDPHVTVYEKDSARSPIYFTYKSPEELSQAQERYLTEQMTAINDALYNPDMSDNTWENYVDTDILARYYIVQEIVDDYEAFHGSCYLYKNRGENEKWKFGPVWDFGSAFNYTKTQFIYQGREWHNTWIEQMCKHPSFMTTVKDVWSDFYTHTYPGIYDYIDRYASRISAAAKCDATRWPKYGTTDLEGRVADVKARLKAGVEWLAAQWGPMVDYRFYFRDDTTPAWKDVRAYVWYTVANDMFFPLGSWPGTLLTPVSLDGQNYLTGHFITNLLPDNAQIIFNNGGSGSGNQTADLKFVAGGLYNRNGYIEQAGVEDISCEASDLSVTVSAEGLTLTSPTPRSVHITSVDGRSITVELRADTPTAVRLDRGIYIIGNRKVVI